VTTVSTAYRYRCDEYAGFSEALSACGIHPIYDNDVIVGAYHATNGAEDDRVLFENGDNLPTRLLLIATMVASVHEGAA